MNVCAYYGHDYRTQLAQTQQLPAGYKYEVCAQCGDDRTVLEY